MGNKEAELEAKLDAMRHRKKKWKSNSWEVKYKSAKTLGSKKGWKSKAKEQAAKVHAMRQRKKKWKSKAAEVKSKGGEELHRVGGILRGRKKRWKHQEAEQH